MHQHDLPNDAHRFTVLVAHPSYDSVLVVDDGGMAESYQDGADVLRPPRRYKGLRRTQQLLTDVPEPLIEPSMIYKSSSGECGGMAEQNTPVTHGLVTKAW